MDDKIYYETGISNSGTIERFETERAANKRAQALANESQTEVFVDKRTEDDFLGWKSFQPAK